MGLEERGSMSGILRSPGGRGKFEMEHLSSSAGLAGLKQRGVSVGVLIEELCRRRAKTACSVSPSVRGSSSQTT